MLNNFEATLWSQNFIMKEVSRTFIHNFVVFVLFNEACVYTTKNDIAINEMKKLLIDGLYWLLCDDRFVMVIPLKI